LSNITADGTSKISEFSPEEHNANLNQWGADGSIQLNEDKEAARQLHLQEINVNSVFFYDTKENLNYKIDNGYYDPEVIGMYSAEFLDKIFADARNFKFRFPSYVGALKFYAQYAMKTRDGEKYLERFEDRCVMVSLGLAQGDEVLALNYLSEILSGRFQPATPTFLNMGKKDRGDFVSCFLVNIQDSMNSISKAIDAALQLSKRGGGVGLNINNIREVGSPIKGVEGASSGVLPVMKLLEDSFSYANQLGQRQGAGAVYLNIHHPDIHTFLDTKKENADEKIRIKTLSLGVIIPNITFELARTGEDMYLFSPHDVEKVYGKPFSEIYITQEYYNMVDNPKIKKYKTSARKLLQKIAEIQTESGYPYIMFEDNVNDAHNIEGKVQFSNICIEIMQAHEKSEIDDETGEYTKVGRDVSCNLGSLDIAKVLDGGNIGHTVEVAMRALTSVSDQTSLKIVPAIKNGNDKSHSVGLGFMNLHGALARDKMKYGSEESIDFASVFSATVRYHVLRASWKIAVEKKETFYNFEKSKYATGEAFNKYIEQRWTPKTGKVAELFANYGISIPTVEDWKQLREDVMRDGIYHAYQQAIAPTGSISYVRSATASVQPIIDVVETRKEGKMGRVYAPAPFLDEGAFDYYETAYDIGPEKLIDMMSVIQEHVDQSISTTLYFKDTVSTRDINKAQLYAWRKGIKSLYYNRIKRSAVDGTALDCVSCSI